MVNGDVYVGSCEDVQGRLKRHNSGEVKSTKGYRPWKLLGYEEFATRSEAILRERYLKNHQQKEILKRKYILA
jgi:putative endonuclease